jgi:hypothetical protein
MTGSTHSTTAAKHKSIDARIKALKKGIGRRRRRRFEAKQIMLERYGGIEQFVRNRRGHVVHVTPNAHWVFPDSAEGRRDLKFVLNCIADAGGDTGWNVAHYIEEHAPWVPREVADALTDRICRAPRRWNAEAAAHHIGLTYDVRYRWKITTIGAIDVSPRRRRTLAEKRKRAWEQDRRHAAGATPQSESLERAAPWLKDGISRKTFFRREQRRRWNFAVAALRADGMTLFCDLQSSSETPSKRVAAGREAVSPG